MFDAFEEIGGILLFDILAASLLVFVEWSAFGSYSTKA